MNVVSLKAQPKSVTYQYRHHTVIVNYIPDKQQWSWQFTHTTEVNFGGIDKTERLARKSAQHMVDRIQDET